MEGTVPRLETQGASVYWRGAMAIAIYFNPDGMSTSKYDEVMTRLEAAGQGWTKGRTHHSTFGPEDRLVVYEVWDSQEDSCLADQRAPKARWVSGCPSAPPVRPRVGGTATASRTRGGCRARDRTARS